MSDDDDDSMSDKDLEVENVEEGANVRVVQSSMHASIMQNSLFKVAENKKESESESENPKEEVKPIENIEKAEKAEKGEEEKEEKKEKEEKGEKESPKIVEETIQKSEEIKIEQAEIKETVKVEEKVEVPKPIKNETKGKIISAHLQEIFEEKKKKKIPKIDVEKRFYEYKDKVKKKVESLQEEKNAKEIQLCTFQPNIQAKNQPEDRKFSNFLHHMETLDKQRKENIEKRQLLKEENDNPKNSYRPMLSKGTLKIAGKNKSTGNLHEKLFKESSELKKKKEVDSQAILDGICTFKPIVNQKSLLLKREGQINQRLYEEAQAKTKQKQEIIPEKKTEKLISDNSENIIREKFLKEITETFPVHESEGEKMIEYKDFLHTLEKIRFINSKLEYPKYNEERDIGQKA